MLPFKNFLSVAALFGSLVTSPLLLFADESQRLHQFLEKAYEDELSRKPIMQAYLGIKTNYGEWDDISEERIGANM